MEKSKLMHKTAKDWSFIRERGQFWISS